MPVHFTRADLGRLCAGGCGTRVPKTLEAVGIYAHPTCGPSELNIVGPPYRYPGADKVTVSL